MTTDDYTPTTDEVRVAVSNTHWGALSGEAFDRWLATFALEQQRIGAEKALRDFAHSNLGEALPYCDLGDPQFHKGLEAAMWEAEQQADRLDPHRKEQS